MQYVQWIFEISITKVLTYLNLVEWWSVINILFKYLYQCLLNKNIMLFNTLISRKYLILDSVRSDECIDFIIMYVFKLSVITVWGIKNDSIFYFSIFYGRKVNLVDTLRGSKIRFFIVIKSVGKNEKKMI